MPKPVRGRKRQPETVSHVDFGFTSAGDSGTKSYSERAHGSLVIRIANMRLRPLGLFGISTSGFGTTCLTAGKQPGPTTQRSETGWSLRAQNSPGCGMSPMLS